LKIGPQHVGGQGLWDMTKLQCLCVCELTRVSQIFIAIRRYL